MKTYSQNNYVWFYRYLNNKNAYTYDISSGICLLKVNKRNTRAMCEICSKLTIKTLQRRQRRRSGFLIVNFEEIPLCILVFLLLTLNK